MKKLLLAFLSSLIIAAAFAQKVTVKSAGNKAISKADFVPGKVIVKLKSTTSQARTLSAESILKLADVRIDAFIQKFPVTKAKSNAATLKLAEDNGLSRIYELSLSENTSVIEVVEELRKNENVEYAEPLYIHRAHYFPNDTQYADVQNYLAQVKAPQAWDLIRNDNKVVIAIVDSGSDLDHEDLAANIYKNTADPINGIDDDGDGYIDNYQGWDFVGASENNIVEDNDPNATQPGGDHGIHVSGIASAVSDNGKGIASIAFNCAKLMILKTASDQNGTDIVRGYEGIKYAADHGAQIINCSWGSENQSYYGQDIVNYAIARGCLIVAAAGNSGSNVPQYPAAYPGVLAVANLLSDDQKSGDSNYGPYVSIAAPGSGIMSTVLNTYGQKSGTSMASPVVASAAALVKAYFPSLTMQQVGEQLRATADNIDAQNPALKNQLGRGRLNVYRALTESQPSIKRQSLTITDKGSGTFAAGDTITIYASFKNFLNPVTNLKISLKSDDPNLVVTIAQVTIPGLGTLATQAGVGPFKVYVLPETPENYSGELRFEYSANNNSYLDFEGFTVQLNRDYLNLETTAIATTVTSKGTIGFLKAGGEEGTRGFQFEGEQLLYESALMIGNSSNRVSNNARTTDAFPDNHFLKQVKVHGVARGDTLLAEAGFDDSSSQNPLNIYVEQRSIVVNNTERIANTLITEYEVHNQNDVTLNNVYVALFQDWDINGGSANATQFDPDKNIAYVYDRTSNTHPYAGVKLLSQANPSYYPLSNRLSSSPLANDDFTMEEKFETMSGGIARTELGTTGSGTDISFVIGYGPYSIPANGSIKAAFALIGGDNEAVVNETATEAVRVYEKINLDIDPQVEGIQLYSYFNEYERIPYVAVSLPEKSTISLDLYNMRGQVVNSVKNGSFVKGVYHFPVYNTQMLSSGTYFYRLRANGTTRTFKTTIIN